MKDFYAGKKILITGAAGTVGRELVKQLMELGPSELRLMDNNETETFFLMEKLREHRNIHCFMGDIRDLGKLSMLAEGADIIIHTAAYKHVILSEYNPTDVVQTNILGVEKVINAARASGSVSHVLFTSSDKAVNPTNVMGTSKLMGERLITAANTVSQEHKTIFTSTRFGNVIGSRGSVVPLFLQQIRKGGPVTLTDERMTRFIMTIEESARLVLTSLCIARGGEVFVTKMPVAGIRTLAEVMIALRAEHYGHKTSDIEIKLIGGKPGEKLYEELMSDEEVPRAMELREMFSVVPAFKSIYGSIDYTYPDLVTSEVDNSYISANEPMMSAGELRKYLLDNKVLESVEQSLSGGLCL